MELFSANGIIFIFAAIVVLAAGILIGARLSHLRAENKFVRILQQKEVEWQAASEDMRKAALAKSRQVIGGSFSEQLAPFLPGFPFDPTEARFIGKPVDFLVFRGLAAGQVDEVVFVEVKSGASRLNGNEQSLKNCIEQKKVSFVEYRVPVGLTSQDRET
jgi:predicted Holliday junction resolvase-like endonuclease